METTERLSELMSSCKEIEQEELFLTKLLSKLDKEIHALQVEQVSLVNVINQTNIQTNCVNVTIVGDISESTENEDGKDSALENGHEIDLRLIKKCNESEENEDDDLEKEAELQENSADFDYL